MPFNSRRPRLMLRADQALERRGWLTVAPVQLARFYVILDNRERPYYEHRLAA